MRCWMSRIGWSGAAFVGLLAIGATPQEPLQESLFTRDERLKVLEYWANPERYASSLPPNASKVGAWQVRLSEKASKWLWDYRKALNLPKIPPGEVPPPLTPEQQGWENWIDARVAWDRWQAGKTSEERNAQRQGRKPAFDEPQPPNPGPIPAALFDLAGEPPAFADVVSPSAHRIRFDDGVQIDYVDNPNMRPRYAYYRFPQGVMHAGNRVRDMAPAELERLFEEAGVTASERRVMAVVSLLEGGFESVNTYDTGFVSVGFIQFACLSGGAGSLGQVLLKLKSEKPDEFQTHFRRLGIDVTPSGQLAAISLLNGEELWGPRARKRSSRQAPDRRVSAGGSGEPRFSRGPNRRGEGAVLPGKRRGFRNAVRWPVALGHSFGFHQERVGDGDSHGPQGEHRQARSLGRGDRFLCGGVQRQGAEGPQPV